MAVGFGMPKMDWSPLQAIGQQLTVNSELNHQRELMKKIGGHIQAGDYDGAAQTAFAAGDTATALNVLKLGQTAKQQALSQQASQEFSTGLGGVFGGGAPGGFGGPNTATSGAPTAPTAGSPLAPSFTATSGDMGDYLSQVRAKESGGNDLARNPNSTAKGRYQFTEGTWKNVARTHPELGLTPDGWRDPAQQEKAMQAFTADNAKALSSNGIPINPANLYGAHFLGAGGAARFIPAAVNNPDAPAVSFVSPDAAKANRTVFFNRDGSPKTAGEVYSWMGASRGGGQAPSPALPQRAAPPTGDPGAFGAPVQTADMQLGAPPQQMQPGQPGAPAPAVPQVIGQTPTAAIAQSPLSQRIPFLLRAAGHPNLPEPQREVAKTLLKTALDESSMPPEAKLYTWSKANGETQAKSIAEFKREMSADRGNKTAEDIVARQAAAVEQGLSPGSPAYQSFVLTGKMPREDQQPITATDKKAIMEADEGVMSAESAISNLRQAKELSKQAYVGPTASVRAKATGLLGSPEGLATIELDNLVSTNALSQLKAIFGAAPTEGERKILMDIQGSSSMPDAARQKIYDRAISMAERRLSMNRERVNEMRAGTFYRPGGGLSGPAATPAGAPGVPPPPQSVPAQPAPNALPGQTAPVQPPLGGPAPITARQPAPAPAGAPVAVNPNTGQRLILQNGQWVPLPSDEGRPQT